VAELQQNRYDKLIRRVGGIIGPGSMVSEAITELFPMIDVENVPGELLALMGTRMAWARADLTSGGGLHPQVQLFNPVDSATILTVTSLQLSHTPTGGFEWGTSNAAMTTVTTNGEFRDTRLRVPAGNQAVGEIRTQSSAVPVGGAQEILVSSNVAFTINDENGLVVLSPGFGLDIQNTALASRLIASFAWRERALESSEVDPVG